MKRRIEIAIPSYWWDGQGIIEIHFEGLLRRAITGLTPFVTGIEDSNYGGVAVLTCDEEIESTCEIAATRITEALVYRDLKDPNKVLRDMSTQDRLERKKIEQLLETYLKEIEDTGK